MLWQSPAYLNERATCLSSVNLLEIRIEFCREPRRARRSLAEPYSVDELLNVRSAGSADFGAVRQRPGDRESGWRQRAKQIVQQALNDACRVLSDPTVPGITKRDILMSLVDKVVCKKYGVEVHFVPGLFDEEAGENEPISNCYTTCIGISTHR